MEDRKTRESVDRNRRVDRDALAKAQELLQRMRDSGVKATSPSASPPTDPYSSQEGTRLLRRRR
jgi:hypothetical protein